MPTSLPLDKHIEFTYEQEGGWHTATQIFTSDMSYEEKLDSIRDQFKVSRNTATRWYIHFNKLRKAK